MRIAKLGPLGDVSRLTLGGGGIGQGWGETSREEAIATIMMAIDRGITVLDAAPLYRNCEAIIGETFGGKLPEGVRITTKCRLGTPPRGETEAKLAQSLEASLAAMKLERVDVYFLHTNICADDYNYAIRPDRQYVFATNWSTYTDEFIPAMEKLKAQGKIGHWAITGTGVPRAIVKALQHTAKPAIVQAITNLMDSAGGIRNFAEPAEPRAIIQAAVENKVGVMGIRAVQAGALTNGIDRTLAPDHAEVRDFARAATYRALCREIGEDPAVLAHRYALSMPGVDTVILGVKNRQELQQCLDAEAQGALDPALKARIDALGLRADHFRN
jgi:aryl-alcohol dehydrogenase-like predicted oxidoreductase